MRHFDEYRQLHSARNDISTDTDLTLTWQLSQNNLISSIPPSVRAASITLDMKIIAVTVDLSEKMKPHNLDEAEIGSIKELFRNVSS